MSDNLKEDVMNAKAQQEEEKTSAYLIKTDKLHRFVTDEQIKDFSSKISMDDLKDYISGTKKELEVKFNKKYDNIFNTPEIYKSIKKLSIFLNNNEEILNMIKELKNLDTDEKLKEHLDSGNHIKESDRVNLDLLRFVVNNSYADWNADESDINYIKNKPTALKADGGNADTVGGYHPDELLIGTKSDTIVIGCTNKDDCDYFIKDTSEDISYIIQPIINNMKDGGSILFREGTYNLSSLNIFNDCIYIKGIGKATKMNINSFKINASQITISDCSLYIDDFSISGNNILIKNNSIYNTGNNNTINFNSFVNSIIKDNFFIDYSRLFYSGNNIISDNIYR